MVSLLFCYNIDINEKMEYEKNVTRVAFKKVIIKCSSATVLMK